MRNCTKPKPDGWPLVYECFGAPYLGAAHGHVGVLAMLALCAPLLAPADREAAAATLARLLDARFAGGNLPIVLGDDARALAVAAALQDAGYYVRAVRPPTVPEGTSRLRICLSAAHEDAQIDGLLAALKQALGALPAPACA